MDAFILISFITGGIIIALVVNIITQHNKIKRFAERLRRNFGQIERKEYDPEKAASYRGYYLNHLDDDGFYIDDIMRRFIIRLTSAIHPAATSIFITL